jgi:cytochrome c-type biogenesis protein CcmH/NrfG
MDWVWWVAGGAVLFGLLVLALVVLGTLRRLGPLQRAMSRAKQQVAAGLDEPARAEMEDNLAALRTRMERTQAHLAMIKAYRDDGAS